MRLSILIFLVCSVFASITTAHADEYKKMDCTYYNNNSGNHIATYEEGFLYDSININFYNEGYNFDVGCNIKFNSMDGAEEFKGINFEKAHYKKCQIEDGIFFSRRVKKSNSGHILIQEMKTNFLNATHSYGRWLCDPGQDNCPRKEWFNYDCKFVE